MESENCEDLLISLIVKPITSHFHLYKVLDKIEYLLKTNLNCNEREILRKPIAQFLTKTLNSEFLQLEEPESHSSSYRLTQILKALRNLEDKSDFQEFNFPCGVIKLKQLTFSKGEFGWTAWDAGALMALLISEGKITSKRPDNSPVVLELGCGTGIVGITASKMKLSDHIIITDYQDDIINIAKENLKFNNCDAIVGKLNWFDVENLIQCSSSHQNNPIFPLPFHSAHIILASDCIYSNAQALALPNVIDAFLDFNPDSCAHILLPLRPIYQKELALFEETMSERNFSSLSIQDLEYKNGQGADTVFRWYQFYRKRTNNYLKKIK